jgi:hypothetical protein
MGAFAASTAKPAAIAERVATATLFVRVDLMTQQLY